MWKICKVCGRKFEGKARSLYHDKPCKQIADTTAKRDWRRVVSQVKGDLDAYADGIEAYKETRGDPRYYTAEDIALTANSGDNFSLVPDDPARQKSDRIEPTARGTTVMVGLKDWGISRAQCPLIVNGAGPRKGHCSMCDQALKDKESDAYRLGL